MSCYRGDQHIADLSEATRVGTRYKVDWVDVPDRDALTVSVRNQFAAGQITRSRKLEGQWWADGGAFFVSSFARTTDGSVHPHDGQVWCLAGSMPNDSSRVATRRVRICLRHARGASTMSKPGWPRFDGHLPPIWPRRLIGNRESVGQQILLEGELAPTLATNRFPERRVDEVAESMRPAGHAQIAGSVLGKESIVVQPARVAMSCNRPRRPLLALVVIHCHRQ